MQEIDLRPEDIYHKSQLNRLLIEIVDTPELANHLAFNGRNVCSDVGIFGSILC